MPGMIGSGFYGGPQGLPDYLTIIGAALKDASPGSSGENVLQARNMLAQRQMAQYQMGMMGRLGGLFGGQAQYQDGPSPNIATPTVAQATAPAGDGAPTAGVGDLSGAMDQAAASAAPGPTQDAAAPFQYQLPQRVAGTGPRIPNLGDPTVQSTLAGLSVMNPELAKNIRENIVAAQPHIIIGPDGTAINDKDPTVAGRVFPKLGEGIVPQRGDAGNLIGSAALPGYTDAAAGIAGATTGAQEQAKAAFDLVDVPLSNGGIVKLPRSIAAAVLTRRALAGGVPGVPGAATSGTPAVMSEIAPTLGASQTPAEAELAKARAATQGKNETDIAGARSAMQQVDDQTNMIAQNLHDMLGETQDPNTGKWVKTKPSMITHLSTGSGTDVIEHVPFINQQAKDLEAKIETVRNGTSFNSLQAIKNALAAAGDGGSGSIRMTDQTARMLGEINGSLNQDQSGPQFEATVRRHLAQLDALSTARHDLFGSQYQGIRRATPGQTGPTANYNSPSAPAAQSAPHVPQPGYVSKGYTFLGGDPHNPASWKKN